MKFPVKEAILSGDWLQCHSTTLFDGEIEFRFKPTFFEKIDLSSIDDPQEIKLDQGILWLLKIEVVNLNKKPINPIQVFQIRLIDNDDFTFKAVEDDHLIKRSEYAQLTGLDRFNGWSSTPDLLPKIRTVGALAFLLPDDDQAEYFFTILDGNIKAI